MTDHDGQVAARLREEIGGTSARGRPVDPLRPPTEGEPADFKLQLLRILLNPNLIQVLLPVAVFCLVTSTAVLFSDVKVPKELGVSRNWLLVVASAFWAVIVLVGFDGVIIQPIIRRVVRRMPRVRESHRLLRLGIGARLSVLESHPKLRELGTEAIAVSEERRRFRNALSRIEICERLLVWLLIAAPVCGYVLRDTDHALLYVIALLAIVAIMLAAVVDQNRKAYEFFRLVPLRGDGV